MNEAACKPAVSKYQLLQAECRVTAVFVVNHRFPCFQLLLKHCHMYTFICIVLRHFCFISCYMITVGAMIGFCPLTTASRLAFGPTQPPIKLVLKFHLKSVRVVLGTDPIHAEVPRKSHPLYHHFYPQPGHTSVLLVLHTTHTSWLLTSDLIPVCTKKKKTQGNN